ncbi:MAG: hypothetical protein GY805_26615 [Chloroflexi bacterium]|nr:hypothetical protein [Chloroflexota bacterium]
MNDAKILLLFQEQNDKANLLRLLLSQKEYQFKQYLYTNTIEVAFAVTTFQPQIIIWQFQKYWEAEDALKEFRTETNLSDKERPTNLLVVDILGHFDSGFQSCSWVDKLLLQPFGVQEFWTIIANLLQDRTL